MSQDPLSYARPGMPAEDVRWGWLTLAGIGVVAWAGAAIALFVLPEFLAYSSAVGMAVHATSLSLELLAAVAVYALAAALRATRSRKTIVCLAFVGIAIAGRLATAACDLLPAPFVWAHWDAVILTRIAGNALAVLMHAALAAAAMSYFAQLGRRSRRPAPCALMALAMVPNLLMWMLTTIAITQLAAAELTGARATYTSLRGLMMTNASWLAIVWTGITLWARRSLEEHTP